MFQLQASVVIGVRVCSRCFAAPETAAEDEAEAEADAVAGVEIETETEAEAVADSEPVTIKETDTALDRQTQRQA